MDIRELTALELGEQIKERKISSPEATRAYLDAAKEDFGKPADDRNKLNAYTELLEESAMAAAAAVQEKIDRGERLSPIAGVPAAIKANICLTEGTSTAASNILSGFRSPFDATLAEKLKAAGAVFIGKTNMDEFAMGNTTEYSCYGISRNPWDTGRVPGGSSGGSAAAVAAGLAPYALGSDTGGSIRQPSSFCNLTGMKPTYGSVSRYGLIAHASSLDQAGPITKDARDCAVILSIISGWDERDSTSNDAGPFDFCKLLHGEADAPCEKGDAGRLNGLKIGLPTNYFDIKGLSADVAERVLEAAETLKTLGAEIIELKLPQIEYAAQTYYVIACAEACSNLARYDGVKYGHRSPDAKTIDEIYSKSRGEGFGAEVKRRALFGYFVLSGENYENYFKQAQNRRSMIKQEYEKTLESCDLILSPVSKTTAFGINHIADDPGELYTEDIFTVSANLSGLPAAAAPCGFGKDAMPIGMQLIGKARGEEQILNTIKHYQLATDHHKRRPLPRGGEL